VAEVNGKEIYNKDVNNLLKDKYFDNARDNYIEQQLIDLEKDKIKPPTSKQLKESFRYYQLVDRKATDLKSNKDKVENYYYISELVKKYTVKKKELNNYVEEQEDTLGNKVYIVYKLEGDHTLINEVDKDIKQGNNIESIQKEKNIKFKKDTVFSKDNIYDVDLSKNKKGDSIHIHSSMEDMNMDDHASHNMEDMNMDDHDSHNMEDMNMDDHASHNMEDMNMDDHASHNMEDKDSNGNKEKNETHTLLIISDVKENYKLDLKENKEEIIDNYVANNYYKEQVDLNNYLRAKYEIRKS
jgi:hypothetical protein